jgi:hypothetical protein
MGTETLDIPIFKCDYSGVRFVLPGDDVQECGFARAVRAHQSNGVARINVKSDIVNGHQTTETFRQAFDG